jgi:hypothetical protein
MKNNDDIPTTDMTEIKQLINRVKRGELDQGDAQLIEKLLNIRELSTRRYEIGRQRAEGSPKNCARILISTRLAA